MKLGLKFWKKNRNGMILCLVLVLGCLFSESAQAAAKYGINNGGEGKWAYHVLNEKKKTVEIRPNELCAEKKGVSKGTVKIPNTITGQDGKTTYKVTKIADAAFCCCICNQCTKEKTVSDRWKNDGEYDESEYDSISEVIIPKNVICIGNFAFSAQESLKVVTFEGNNIEEIGVCAFSGTSISNITIPASCKTIGDYAFECSDLQKITFKGDNITSIGAGAFCYTDLQSIVIPPKIKKIEEDTFVDCDKLKTVTFLQTDNIVVDESAFFGSPVTKVNVQNYIVYQCLIDRFDYEDYVKVDSQSTRLYIEHNGQTVWIDVSKEEIIDLSTYINVPEGKEIYAGSIFYIDTMNPDNKQGKYAYTGNRNSMLDYYQAEGYPYVEISTYMEDLRYRVCAPIAKINSHSDCDITEWTDKDATLGLWANYYFCYHDQFTLSDVCRCCLKIPKGYKFAGYNIHGKTFQPGSVISGKDLDISFGKTVYAELEYQPISYQVAYDFNGGAGSALENTSCTYDKEATLATNTSFNGGYKFVGWCENPNGEGTIYKSGAMVKNLTSTDGEVITLYAIWKDESLVVTFDPNGGTVSQMSKKVRYNQKFGNLPIPKREGYTFKGWTLGLNGGTVVKGDSVVQYNCDFNLFAQWEPKKYIITFNANGGTGGGSKEVKYGKSIGSLPKAQRKGYKLKGWYTAKTGGDKITTTTKVTARKTYYAQWEEKAKTLTIIVNPKNIKKLDGYQVKYGKKGGKMTTKTYASEMKKSITVKITGVKAGETYVAKARSYRKVKGKKKWSKWKTVTKTVE